MYVRWDKIRPSMSSGREARLFIAASEQGNLEDMVCGIP
jgi:hypothetical protein